MQKLPAAILHTLLELVVAIDVQAFAFRTLEAKGRPGKGEMI
jgi:hypothetical protein